MQRTASATWKGSLREGHGSVSTSSGALADAAYSFSTRFEQERGTNPEELVAAAHAACFSMALSGQLAEKGMTPENIHTIATLAFEKLEGGWTISGVHLDTTARIPNADPQAFEQAAERAKETCPISRALKANITVAAKLGA